MIRLKFSNETCEEDEAMFIYATFIFTAIEEYVDTKG